MYQEDLARYTSDHLRSHIKPYLDEVWSEYTAPDSVPLIVPKRIDFSSQVGGMITEYDKILPQYGIDILGKDQAPSDDSLWSYIYSGQINGLVSGGSREAVDYLVARHSRAVEAFIRRHWHLHQHENANFRILEFLFSGFDFSGAEDVSTSDRDIWVAGFSHNVVWLTSEDGPSDENG